MTLGYGINDLLSSQRVELVGGQSLNPEASGNSGPYSLDLFDCRDGNEEPCPLRIRAGAKAEKGLR